LTELLNENTPAILETKLVIRTLRSRGRELISLFNSYAERTLALLILISASPLIAAMLIIAAIETRSLPWYIQERGLTLDKYRFRIYKIRTMKETTEAADNNGIFIKSGLARQVTVAGRFLRRTGLDELPQLVNILKGEMSFIGPRPLSVEDLKLMLMEHPAEYRMRGLLTSKPGISGYWQIFGDRKMGVKNLIELEMKYENEKSPIVDLFLAAVTVPVVVFARHSDAISKEEGE